MSDKDAYVKNASDPKQVKSAGIKERDRRKQEILDLQFILSEQNGRRFLWRLLKHCKAFNSIWEQSAKIHYNAGQQDVAHFVMAEIVEADQDAFLKMMKENQNI